jgi:type II secretion system protein H
MISRRTCPPRAAFTLIEIMVVCAIIGIVMTMAIPSIYRQLHPESMQKAVNDIIEACEDARSHAVLKGTTMKLVLRPADRTFQVMQGSGTTSRERLESKSVAGEEWRMEERPVASTGSTLSSFKLADSIRIDGIGLNRKDYTEDELVEVNFYENGTCDEFHIVIGGPDGDVRMIILEVSTAVPDIETDPRKFMSR